MMAPKEGKLKGIVNQAIANCMMRPKEGNLTAIIYDIRLHDEAQTGNVLHRWHIKKSVPDCCYCVCWPWDLASFSLWAIRLRTDARSNVSKKRYHAKLTVCMHKDEPRHASIHCANPTRSAGLRQLRQLFWSGRDFTCQPRLLQHWWHCQKSLPFWHVKHHWAKALGNLALLCGACELIHIRKPRLVVKELWEVHLKILRRDREVKT